MKQIVKIDVSLNKIVSFQYMQETVAKEQTLVMTMTTHIQCLVHIQTSHKR